VKEEKLHLTVGMKGKKLYIVVCSIKVPRMRMHIDEQHWPDCIKEVSLQLCEQKCIIRKMEETVAN
jgi:hypothetical protein